MTVLDAVVVEAVLEARAECSDVARARAALSDALLDARAPKNAAAHSKGARTARGSSESAAHWTVTMAVAPSAPGPILVDAVIVDDAGSIVAQRTLTDRNTHACLPLARAVGAWASLVVDAEMTRAKDDDGRDGSASAPASGAPDPSVVIGREGSIRDSAPEKEALEARRSIEIGTMGYLRNGLTTNGGIAGFSPFITVEVTPSLVLRPALFFGRSTDLLSAPSQNGTSVPSHFGARVDLCRRVPGNYIERQGIEADFCAGVEGGIVTLSPKRPDRLGAGPSLNMRGELAGGVALEIRGLCGINFIQYAAAETPLVFAAAELGASVRFR